MLHIRAFDRRGAAEPARLPRPFRHVTTSRPSRSAPSTRRHRAKRSAASATRTSGGCCRACATPIRPAAARCRSSSTASPSAARADGTRASDLTALFPGYPGINTRARRVRPQHTAYANGLHTIVWVVTDSGGVTSGVGSRYFSVFNTSSPITTASAGAMRPIGPDLGRRVGDLGGRVAASTVGVRDGFDLRAPDELAAPASTARRACRRPSAIGWRSEWRATRRSARRLRMSLLATWSSTAICASCRTVVVRSGRGAFYWQPGLGYVGDYDLLFVRTGADGARERIPVRVTLRERADSAIVSNRPRGWSF